MSPVALACDWCGQPFTAARRDAQTCSKRCRQARHRARIGRAELEHAGRPLRLAYADPPYPGKSRLYLAEATYAGEVDHAALLSQLQEYDGWALSTSAEALSRVVALVVAQDLEHRVAVWTRRPRPHQTARVLTGYEVVIFHGARRTGPQVTDVHRGVEPRRRPTLPGAVIGAKPPDFCEWLFKLLGARPGDSFDDLFPGSGIVGRCWRDYSGRASIDVDRDASTAGESDPSARRATRPVGRRSPERLSHRDPGDVSRRAAA